MSKNKDAVRLTLFDANGTPRAGLAVTKDDGPLLVFMDEKQQPGLKADSEGIGVYDQSGESQLLIFGNKDTGPRIQLFDKKGKRRVELGITAGMEGPTPTLAFNDSNQLPKLFLLADDDEASLSLRSNVNLELTNSSKQASLGFFDTERSAVGSPHSRGNARLALKVDSRDATLSFSDSAQKSHAFIGVGPEGPQLGTIKDGKATFTAP